MHGTKFSKQIFLHEIHNNKLPANQSFLLRADNSVYLLFVQQLQNQHQTSNIFFPYQLHANVQAQICDTIHTATWNFLILAFGLFTDTHTVAHIHKHTNKMPN